MPSVPRGLSSRRDFRIGINLCLQIPPSYGAHPPRTGTNSHARQPHFTLYVLLHDFQAIVPTFPWLSSVAWWRSH